MAGVIKRRPFCFSLLLTAIADNLSFQKKRLKILLPVILDPFLIRLTGDCF